MATLQPMKLSEVLAERGLSLESHANGEAPAEITDREIKREPTPRANYLRDIYFDTLSSLDIQESYWYSRAAYLNIWIRQFGHTSSLLEQRQDFTAVLLHCHG